MSIAYVQSAQVNASGTSVTCAYTNGNGASNASIVAARVGNINATYTITDSQNNTYTSGSSDYNTGGAYITDQSGDTLIVQSCLNIKAGPNTVTFTQTGASTTIRGAIHEFTGLASINNGGANSVGAAFATTAVASPFIPTTNPNCLLFGATITNNGTFALNSLGNMGTPNTAILMQQVSVTKLYTQYAIVSTIGGNYLNNSTLAAADEWGTCIIAYAASSTALPLLGQICL